MTMFEVHFLMQEENGMMSGHNPWDVSLFDNMQLDKVNSHEKLAKKNF
jgi:hypothetical protein